MSVIQMLSLPKVVLELVKLPRPNQYAILETNTTTCRKTPFYSFNHSDEEITHYIFDKIGTYFILKHEANANAKRFAKFDLYKIPLVKEAYNFLNSGVLYNWLPGMDPASYYYFNSIEDHKYIPDYFKRFIVNDDINFDKHIVLRISSISLDCYIEHKDSRPLPVTTAPSQENTLFRLTEFDLEEAFKLLAKFAILPSSPIPLVKDMLG
ncbi:hypothetical protein ACFQ3S_10985 [Mucilaginibacter terrae]|uniref:hypothetical protein n=1 Tax=Mucilaginibacter terrae TaxID=1955052 RepID=UPI003634C9E2